MKIDLKTLNGKMDITKGDRITKENKPLYP
jgi:hypothetical protein